MGLGTGATAAIIGGIGAAGSVASGVIGANAAGNAASTQANAANNAAQLESQTANNSLNFNKLQYQNSLNMESPWVNTGQAANSQLAFLMGLRPNQGLPPGVINPNAPQTTANPGTAGIVNRSSLLPGGIAGIGNSRAIGQAQPLNGTAQIPNSQNILSGNVQQAQAQGGTAPITQPGAVSSATSDTNSPLNTINGVSPVNGGTFQLPTSGTTAGQVASASTNVGGTGQVPIQGGSTTDPNAATGGFGSLAQGWNQTFNSPTNVTEQNDPGYEFRLQQGANALQNSAAARGGLLSGGTAKAINDYAQNSASNEYGNVYNRALQNYQTNYNTFSNDQANEFNRLSALSGTGQTTAGQLSSAGINAANTNANIGLTSAGQIGQQLNNAGAANASGYVGGANAIGGAISGAANSVGGALSLYQLLNQQNNGGNGV